MLISNGMQYTTYLLRDCALVMLSDNFFSSAENASVCGANAHPRKRCFMQAQRRAQRFCERRVPRTVLSFRTLLYLAALRLRGVNGNEKKNELEVK